MASTRDGRMPPHSHAKPRIKPTGMLTSILSATYCWFSRSIPPAWPSIQVNLIYVLKFYSIDCILDSPDFREPLRAIRDIFHCDIGFSRKGLGNTFGKEEKAPSTYTYFCAMRTICTIHGHSAETIFHGVIRFVFLHVHYAIRVGNKIFILIVKLTEEVRKSHRYDIHNA